MTRRVLFFVYGCACYAMFLASSLYALGFVGGFLVPRALDDAARRPLGLAIAIDALLLGLFAVQHSVMARPGFKAVWTRMIPPVVERSTYVLFSSLALLLLFALWEPLGGVVWSLESRWTRAVAWAAFAFGWGLVVVATFLIDHFHLLGLRQVWLSLRGQRYAGGSFVTPGPYRLVRHPLYVGWLFAFWGTPHMTASHLLFALGMTAYILAAIRLEERDLVDELGADYERYRRQVPMLVPRLGRRRRDHPAPATVRTA